MAKTTTAAPTKVLTKKKSKTDLAAPKTQEVIALKAKTTKTAKGKVKADVAAAPLVEAPTEEAPKKAKKSRKADVAAKAQPVVEKSAEGKKGKGTKRKAEEGASQAVEDKKMKKGRKQADAEKVVEIPVVVATSTTRKKVKSTQGDEKDGKKTKEKKTVVADESSPAASEPSPPKPKAKKAKTSKAPPPPDESDEAAEPADEHDDEESVQMFDFSTDDDNSSDDEAMDEDDAPGIDVNTLPTIAKDDAVVKQRLEIAKRTPTADRGVLYLGRVPHGFYEDQMKSYFNQFGDVTRLRLSRNKKTGKSKHYAFIEFESSSVAQIVADTMDNYLLMGHILTCKVIPKDEVHPELWVGANRKWRKVPTARISRLQHNKHRTEAEQYKAEKRLLKRQAEKKRKLVQIGIDYDIEPIAYKKKPKTIET
ncbi:hypothetical protein EUX98_g3911 [Antrodiella citrinella]|uniref:RRM domain-containing protein n=1 Tax=Antrodiella citrinella TaxID=2447956 RepID=A0A4S4MY73_9APHY|nr:hypothetical protein EUX98_g3911 [Antrodiella citrinella]